MQIYINGESRVIPEATTMSALIELLELGGQRIAVEVNEELVPRSQFAAHLLETDDKVEVINAVGGG